MKTKNKRDIKVLIEVSSRHVHLCENDFIKLFGKNERLNKVKELSQKGEFASDKFVSIKNWNKEISNIRVVGPFRKKSQLEISITDSYFLGLNKFPKIRVSGDLKNTIKIPIKGIVGRIKVPCIIAKRHLHLSEEDSKKFKIKNNQKVSIKIEGKRSLIFNEVVTRVSKNYKTSLHLDTDEGNAAGISKKAFGKIIIN